MGNNTVAGNKMRWRNPWWVLACTRKNKTIGLKEFNASACIIKGRGFIRGSNAFIHLPFCFVSFNHFFLFYWDYIWSAHCVILLEDKKAPLRKEKKGKSDTDITRRGVEAVPDLNQYAETGGGTIKEWKINMFKKVHKDGNGDTKENVERNRKKNKTLNNRYLSTRVFFPLWTGMLVSMSQR